MKPTPNCKKSLPEVQTFELSWQICQNLKLKTFRLSPLPMQNPYSKTFLNVKFLFVNQFSNFLRHILGLQECLNHDKIIHV